MRSRPTLRLILRIIRPAKYSEQVSGWLDLIPYAGTIVAILIAWLLDRSFAEMVIIGLLVLLALSLVAAYRLEVEVDELEATKRIPTNRNDLVAATSVLETSARDVIGADLRLRSLRMWTSPKASDESLRRVQEDHRKAEERLREDSQAAHQSYRRAQNDFTKELRIAGEDFRRRLRSYPQTVDVEVSKCRYDDDEEVASEALKRISQATEEILSVIDEGRAYQPAKSP